MISICTVVFQSMNKYYDLLFRSLARTKQVKEVLLAVIDADANEKHEWEAGGIRFRQFGCTFSDEIRQFYGHSMGLHECIDKATEEYVMLCDPDVFFYGAIDQLYLNLMTEHKLDVIGVSHHNAVSQCYTFFPCVMNLLVKKTSLPGEDFLRGRLKFGRKLERTHLDEGGCVDCPGKYLVPGIIPEYADIFPCREPRALYDIGCNLYLWAMEKRWSWLSFQTTDCHLYTTRYYKSNGAKPKLKYEKLLFHATSGAFGRNFNLIRTAFEGQND